MNDKIKNLKSKCFSFVSALVIMASFGIGTLDFGISLGQLEIRN